jgi:hypothetical protein
VIFARRACAALAASAVLVSASAATAGTPRVEPPPAGPQQAVALPAGPQQAAPPAGSHDVAPLLNRGFEDGMSSWTCAPGSATVVTDRVRTGSRALAGAAGTPDDARCWQPIALTPDVTYRITAWVRGRYVLMGVGGHKPAWQRGGDDWYELVLEFRARPGQTTAPFYFAGTNGRPYGVDGIRIEGLCPTNDPRPTPCPSLFWP